MLAEQLLNHEGNCFSLKDPRARAPTHQGQPRLDLDVVGRMPPNGPNEREPRHIPAKLAKASKRQAQDDADGLAEDFREPDVRVLTQKRHVVAVRTAQLLATRHGIEHNGRFFWQRREHGRCPVQIFDHTAILACSAGRCLTARLPKSPSILANPQFGLQESTLGSNQLSMRPSLPAQWAANHRPARRPQRTFKANPNRRKRKPNDAPAPRPTQLSTARLGAAARGAATSRSAEPSCAKLRRAWCWGVVWLSFSAVGIGLEGALGPSRWSVVGGPLGR